MIKHPVIFLDIDGVLATPRQIHAWVERNHEPCPPGLAQIDQECVKVLQDIVKRLDAYVVISSTWRKCDDDMYELVQLFSKYEIPIVGVTPSSASGNRGEEIFEYMSVHHLSFEDIIVIDDEVSDLQPLKGRILKTDGDVGLQPYDDDRAVSLMFGPFRKVRLTKMQWMALLNVLGAPTFNTSVINARRETLRNYVAIKSLPDDSDPERCVIYVNTEDIHDIFLILQLYTVLNHVVGDALGMVTDLTKIILDAPEAVDDPVKK